MSQQQLEQQLRRARINAEVDPALHARLMSRLNAEHDARQPASWRGGWLAGAAASVVLGIVLVTLMTQNPPEPLQAPAAVALESPVPPLVQPLSGLVAGLNQAPAPPEQWLRQEMEALESDLRKLLPPTRSDSDPAPDTASG